MTLRVQLTQFRWKCSYFTKCFRNLITKMPLTSHFMKKFFKVFTKFWPIKMSLNGSKINPFSSTFISVSVRKLWLRLEKFLEKKIPLSRPSSIKVALLVEDLSVVIEVVAEGPPGLVWFILFLFSLIQEMLISVSLKLDNIFTRSSSLALKTWSDFKFTLQLLLHEPFICWLTNTLPSTFCTLSGLIYFFFSSGISFSIANWIFPPASILMTPRKLKLALETFISIILFLSVFFGFEFVPTVFVITFDNTLTTYVLFLSIPSINSTSTVIFSWFDSTSLL